LLCAAAAEAAKAPAALRDMHCPMRAQPTFCFESRKILGNPTKFLWNMNFLMTMLENCLNFFISSA
jgi:hypothetical protein